MKKNQPKITPQQMVGTFFHSIKDGCVCWQGFIAAEPMPGWYLVQLFEWLMGQQNVQRLVRIEEMKDWLFYRTSEEMCFSYEHGVAKRLKKPVDSENIGDGTRTADRK